MNTRENSMSGPANPFNPNSVATPSQACIEHIRPISKERFSEKVGSATEIEMAAVRKHLSAIFSE